MWRAGGLQLCKAGFGKGALIPNDHLRHKRLQVWTIANDADMRQTASTFGARRSLRIAVWVLSLVGENVPLGIALKQTYLSLVQLDAQRSRARRHLRQAMVPPLPHRRRLGTIANLEPRPSKNKP